jgi:protein TonB
MANDDIPAPDPGPDRDAAEEPERSIDRAEFELATAERWMGVNAGDRRLVWKALAIALVLHGTALFAQLPSWASDPVRVDAPREQSMKVQFLKPPPPPPKQVERPPEPPRKKIPRPDPTPEEPEPIVEPPPPPPAPPEPVSEPAPVAPDQMGPVRVAPGQGPGLIKRVEPIYPPMARAARVEGTVVIDAVINKDGSVSDVKVLQSANAMLEQSAVQAVRQWRFTPGPYAVVLTVTVHFTLR